MSKWVGLTARRGIIFSQTSLYQKALPLESGASGGNGICESIERHSTLLCCYLRS